jgi:hypothetical protein
MENCSVKLDLEVNCDEVHVQDCVTGVNCKKVELSLCFAN